MSSSLSSHVHRAPGPPDYWLLRRLWKAARDPIGFYDRAWRSYGDVVRFHWYGSFHAYLVVGPEMAEHVMQANWSNYPKGFFYKRLSIFTGQGLFTSHGDLWLRQRRLAQPAFHRQKVAGLAGSMAATVAEMLEEWDRKPDHHVVDIADEMMRLTLRIAGRALFGTDLNGERAERLHKLMNVAMMHVEHRFNPLTLPENVPTARNRKFVAAKTELDHWILKLAHERLETGERPGDLLSMLLDARDEETGTGMSDRQLVDEVITLLVAGHETSADALAWAWSLLAKDPDKRARLEEESDRVLNGRTPTFEDSANLPYAMMVFQEALRLYPPIWALAREAKADDEIGGYPVAARSTVVVPPFLTHRHPAHWENPNAFEPERFSPEKSAGRHKFAYFPFGGGPRLCLGMGFALLEGQLALAAMAGRYRLELAPGEKLDMHPSLALRPKGGLKMIRHRRS